MKKRISLVEGLIKSGIIKEAARKTKKKKKTTRKKKGKLISDFRPATTKAGKEIKDAYSFTYKGETYTMKINSKAHGRPAIWLQKPDSHIKIKFKDFDRSTKMMYNKVHMEIYSAISDMKMNAYAERMDNAERVFHAKRAKFAKPLLQMDFKARQFGVGGQTEFEKVIKIGKSDRHMRVILMKNNTAKVHYWTGRGKAKTVKITSTKYKDLYALLKKHFKMDVADYEHINVDRSLESLSHYYFPKE